jgi:hypothetical protein
MSDRWRSSIARRSRRRQVEWLWHTSVVGPLLIHMPDPIPCGWTVEPPRYGREGYMFYNENGRSIPFLFVLTPGDVVARISLGTPAEWRQKHAWAADRRSEIVDRVIQSLLPKDATGWRAEIVASPDGSEELLIRDPSRPAAPDPEQNYTRAREKYRADGSWVKSDDEKAQPVSGANGHPPSP